MNKFQSFQEFLTTQSVQVDILGFILNLLLSAILSYLLGKLYVKYGTSLSNRVMFSRNFVLLATTTMLIITIVKSSLALSLGLVGALSIVRFRAAIKEPQELAYLFLTIAIGLGFGADQRIITVLAIAIISGIIIVGSNVRTNIKENRMNLVVTANKAKGMNLDKIIETLNENFQEVNLRRFDESADILEAAFIVEFKNFESVSKAKEEMQSIDPSLKLSFLDNAGII